MINPHLTHKVVLITGANHGIGRAAAKVFAANHARLFLTYFRPPTPFSHNELAQALEKGEGGMPLYHAMQQQSIAPLLYDLHTQGVAAAAMELDLTDPAKIPQLFQQCEAQIGPVDVLVINHTYCVLETFDPTLTSPSPGEDANSQFFQVKLISAPEIDAHFAVNARACALLMSEYFQRYLKRGTKWGRIITISTDAAHAHTANVSYAASKHAIESYSRSAAAEMGKYGITVNIVAPGPIQTGYITPKQESEISLGTPLGRIGKPEDVADVILFLASEQARWLTGQLLYVGGGWRMGQ